MSLSTRNAGFRFKFRTDDSTAAAVRQNLAMPPSDPSPAGDREVLSSLPNARPQRRSAKRDRPARGAKADGAGAAKAKSGAAKAQPGAAKGAKPAAAKPPASAAAKPAARGAAQPRAKAAAKPRAKAAAPAAPAIPPAGYATPRGDDDAPSGADLVTTAVQAAGELAQIGIEVGGRALKAALQRLPRP